MLKPSADDRDRSGLERGPVLDVGSAQVMLGEAAASNLMPSSRIYMARSFMTGTLVEASCCTFNVACRPLSSIKRTAKHATFGS